MKTAFKDVSPYSVAIDPVTGQVVLLEADIFTVGAGYLDISGGAG